MLLLIAATLAVYWSVGRTDFISVDDQEYVSANQIVQAGLTWYGLKWAFVGSHVANYHPLTWLSHMLDCQLFGPDPGWHHRINLLLHVVNSVLLFLVLRRMTGRDWCSAFVAFLFALHPQHVESVAWISERKDVLSGLFWMLTLCAWVWYVERRSWQRYSLAMLTFALGLLSKPMVVTLPCVLLLLDFWPLKRVTWFAATPQDQYHRSLGWLIVEKVPFFLLAVGGSIATMLAQSSGGAVVTLNDLPIWMRVGNMLVSYARYVRQFVWPSDLAPFYPLLGPWPTGTVLVAGSMLTVVTLVVALNFRKRPYLVTGWLWFVGTLVPVIGLVHVGNQAMADRYMYLPMIGLGFMTAWGFADLVGRVPRLVPAAVSVLAIIACASVTHNDVPYWRNSETLYARSLERTEPNVFALHVVAVAQAQRDEFDGAIQLLEQAKKLQPGNPHVRRALGYTLREAKRFDEAKKQLDIALKIDREEGRTWDELGRLYTDMKEYKKAAEHFAVAAKIRPDDFDIRMSLAAARKDCGQHDEALNDLRIAQRMNPRLAQPWYFEGVWLLEAGETEPAIKALANAVARDPRKADAQYRLGVALMQIGQGASAVAPLMNAVQLAPNSPDALTRLAWLLAAHPDARLRQGGDALYFAQRADELSDHKSPEALDALAAAQAEQMQFDLAVETARKASELATKAGKPDLASRIDARIESYRLRRGVRDGSLAGAETGEVAP